MNPSSQIHHAKGEDKKIEIRSWAPPPHTHTELDLAQERVGPRRLTTVRSGNGGEQSEDMEPIKKELLAAGGRLEFSSLSYFQSH